MLIKSQNSVNWPIIKIVFLVLTYLLGSCSRPQNKSKKLIIDVKREDKVSAKDLFSKVEVIRLETSKFSIISHADKVILYKDCFYVLDKSQKAIFIFTSNGRFLSSIKRFGQGPQEYLDLNDFVINPFTDNVEILSARGRITIYNTTGKYVSTIVLPKVVRAVDYMIPITKDEVVLYSNSEDNKLMFFSRDQNKILKTTHEIPKFIWRETMLNFLNSPFFSYKDRIMYYEVFSNNVYQLDSRGLKLTYSWDFDKYNLDYKKLPIDKTFEYYRKELQTINGKYASNFMYNIENDHIICTSFTYAGKWKTLIYDKESKTYKVFSQLSEGVSLSSLQFFDGGVFSYINPMNLNVLVNNKVLDLNNVNKVKQIKNDENPVIVKYYFKNTHAKI